jgi:iron-sulfur cluster assembly accessory protein
MIFTESAKDKIKKFLSEQNEYDAFRVKVETGGCNGFKYSHSLDNKSEDDLVILNEEAAVVIADSLSQMYLANTVLDYIDTIGQAGFTFSNPDAKGTCGCGLSFDIG